MAKNPNDIARALNEMVKTLEQLSDAELESVGSILEQQKEIISINQKIVQSKKDLEKLKKREELKEKTLRKEDTKTLKSRLSLISLLDRSNKKLGREPVKKDSPRLSMNFMKSVVENERKQFSLFSSQMQVKQSSQNYDKKEIDTNPELEIKLLKEIDNKIENITSTKSGGLLDFLMSSVKNLLIDIVPGASGALEGVAGAGLLGGLGKLLKRGKGAAKVGEEAAESGGSLLKILGKLKNPKVAIAAGVVAAGAGLYSGMSSDKSDDNSGDTLQTRAKGGKVSKNDVYLVGEKGPELFSPKDNGFIIPNHKIKYNDSSDGSGFNFNVFQESFTKTFKTLLGKVSDGYEIVNKSFIDRIKTVYDDVKNWVLDKLNHVGDVVKNVKEDVSKAAGSFLDNLLGRKPKVENPAPSPQIDLKSSVQNNDQLSIPKVDVNGMLNDVKQDQPVQQLSIPSPTPMDNFANKLPDFSNIKFQNNYTVQPPQPQIKDDGLDIDFWTTDFVKAFSDSIKIKNNNIKVKSNTVSNPFL